MEIKNYCERCGERDVVTTMSQFNTQMICIPCEEEEKEHKDYHKAVEAERKAIQNGNMNFEGIGKPSDL